MGRRDWGSAGGAVREEFRKALLGVCGMESQECNALVGSPW